MCFIILAEDDADDRMMIRRALKEAGRESDIEELTDGVELTDYLEDEDAPWRSSARPALILLDLNMPRKSGRQALREIKSAPELRKVPVVVLTTSSSQIDINESYDAGANAYITKPHSYSELAAIIKSIVEFWCHSARLPS